MSHNYIGYLFKVTVLLAAYFFTARAGLSLDAISGFATLVWPPSGIALAALILYGYRLWPGIFIGAFLVNLVSGAPTMAAGGIALGNTIEALLGAYLLNQFIGFQPAMARLKDAAGLIILVAFISTYVGATIGTLSLLYSGAITSTAFQETWTAWRMGDMLGVLVVAPVLLVWSQPWQTRLTLRRLLEAILYFGLLAYTGLAVFHGLSPQVVEPLSSAYVIFPLLILIAIRFGQHGSTLAILTIATIAIWGAVTQFSPENNNTLSHDLLFLQRFMAVTAITFLIMAAFVSERVSSETYKLRLLRRSIKLMKERHTLDSGEQFNKRQMEIIDNLVDVIKIESGSETLTKKKTDLQLLTRDVIDKLSPIVATKKQTIELVTGGEDFTVSGDERRLAIALENLIINAGRYSHRGKKIDVNLTSRGDTVSLAVKDEGIGIAKKDQDKLFKKFSRIENKLSVSDGGNGLGLYLTNKIVRYHGGKVSITSNPGKGSTFTIRLPK